MREKLKAARKAAGLTQQQMAGEKPIMLKEEELFGMSEAEIKKATPFFSFAISYCPEKDTVILTPMNGNMEIVIRKEEAEVVIKSLKEYFRIE